VTALASILRSRAAWIGLATVLVAAFGLRIALTVVDYVSNFDSATPGLMALHILRGEDFPLFYYGQHYMGALEAYLAAVFFALFGVSDLSLSLSSIAFSLGWIAGTYAIFSEIGGRRAGVVAAATAIVPPWTALWYSVLTYGGYTATFCLGTWALWLCLRIHRLGAGGRAGFVRVAALGLVAGLALWTNYMSASFLLTGGLVLLAAIARGSLRGWRCLRLGWGIPFFLAGVWPVLLTLARHGAGQTETFNLTANYIKRVVSVTFLRNKWGFGELLFAPEHHTTSSHILYAALFGSLAVLAVWTTVRLIRRRETPRFWAVPALYVLVFFALYLPHSMAWTGAPRYLMPVWTLAFAALAAIPAAAGPTRAVRFAACTLAALAVAALLTADLRAIAHRRGPAERDRTARHEFVRLARETGVRGVEMAGGHIWGLEGQVYSFYAQGHPYFASPSTDRYPPHAERLETESRLGFAVESQYLGHAAAALRDLGATFEVRRSRRAALIHSVTVPVRPLRNLTASIRAVTAERAGGTPADSIRDSNIDTGLHGTYAAAGHVTLDLGSPLEVSCLHLMAPRPMNGGLPGGYRLEASDDGATFTVIREVPRRFAVAYAIGTRAYLRGAWGMMEIRFDPLRTRFLRLTPLSGMSQRPDWCITEIQVLGPSGATAAAAAPPVGDLIRRLKAESIGTLIGDRLLSARIRAATRGDATAVRVLTYYKQPDSEPPPSFAVRPGRDVAIAVESCLEPTARAMLLGACGPDAIRTEWRHGDYFVWALNPAAQRDGIRIEWFGRTLFRRTPQPAPQGKEDTSAP
jgi:hypothetical protein